MKVSNFLLVQKSLILSNISIPNLSIQFVLQLHHKVWPHLLFMVNINDLFGTIAIFSASNSKKVSMFSVCLWYLSAFCCCSSFTILQFYKIGTKVKGVDLDAPGSINGVPLLEVDLDSFEDKPWRKPGKIIVDYINFERFLI